ncbi:hypothetical protein [Pseudomonas putida]|uniref:hypothetical protein n=1 Tax=Pseudomonas putida TaxID=303 RepID=UPI0018ABDF18|nr:hypothetical protein [Pseudomonas putida]MBF8671129.1 hypothetical protein [Pseudomonas putida]
MLVPVASAIIPNIMVSPIISAMAYTVGLAHVVIRFVIRLMVGFVIGFVIGFMICFVVGLVGGTIISTIAPATIMAWAAMPTTIATLPAATAAVATTRATAPVATSSPTPPPSPTISSSAATPTTAAAAASATTTVTTTTTATILRIHAGGTANGVRHQRGRSRQHCTDSQSQQAFPEHDEPPLGVAPGCTTHPVISSPPWGNLLTSAAFHLQRLNEILQGLPAEYFRMFLDFLSVATLLRLSPTGHQNGWLAKGRCIMAWRAGLLRRPRGASDHTGASTLATPGFAPSMPRYG